MTRCSTARRSRSSTTWLISSTFGSRWSSSRATEPFTPRCLPRSIWRFRYGKTWVSGTSRRTWSARSGGAGTGTVRDTAERLRPAGRARAGAARVAVAPAPKAPRSARRRSARALPGGALEGLVLLHELLEVGHRGFQGLGGLQHLGHDELVVVEEAPDLLHAPHERPVDDFEGGLLLELQGEVVEQAVLRALHDVAGEPLVQRELDPGVLRGPRAPPEVRREGAHRVAPAPEDQVLGQPAPLFGDRAVALTPPALT